jgi:hypothetical protein
MFSLSCDLLSFKICFPIRFVQILVSHDTEHLCEVTCSELSVSREKTIQSSCIFKLSVVQKFTFVTNVLVQS